MGILLKRAYVDTSESDGSRILVDHLWPRGRSKEALKLSLWAKYISPSNEVRDEFCHIPDKFPAFRKAFTAELNANPRKEEFLEFVRGELAKGPVTLVYAAKDEEYNNAVVLREWLQKKLG